MIELELSTGRGRAASPTSVMLLLMTASFSEVGKRKVLCWRCAVQRLLSTNRVTDNEATNVFLIYDE